MSLFRAVVIEKNDTGQTVTLKDFSEADLMEGDVTLRVTHSTVNYKDGLALTGKSPVVRRFPMIPGIDCAGVVEISSHPDFRAGDRGLVTVLCRSPISLCHLGFERERADAA
jgi:acrylyl-CoA reductase (NADPH)